jgi:glycine dehydrogenase subunit 1
MPFIPHTEHDIEKMLKTIGVDSIDDLFDEIPDSLRTDKFDAIPQGITEMEISALMHERSSQDGVPTCFIGAGAYDHHIPAAVWELTTRGEYYTAYTPYQAEASQGTLQLLYEFQSMLTALTGMDVSNASLYDGASALAEAILMAVRANRKSKSRKILVPRCLHPDYRKTAKTIVTNQKIELVEIPFDAQTGRTDLAALDAFNDEDITALVIPQPNFFGVLEDVDALASWAQERNIFTIAVVNPLAMSMLTPAGEWGNGGVDICVGEGQPLGIPLASGGPYYGFMCCNQKHVRQMPGRIIGRTEDMEGKVGYALTLQAREQHIRRSKATSNICTNQGLMVTASTIHMAMMGGTGLAHAASTSHQTLGKLNNALTSIEGVEQVFSAPVFNESVLKLDAPVGDVLASLAANNLLGGYDLGKDYPELGNALLVCATEKRTDAEIESYREKLKHVLDARRKPSSPATPRLD